MCGYLEGTVFCRGMNDRSNEKHAYGLPKLAPTRPRNVVLTSSSLMPFLGLRLGEAPRGNCIE